MIFNHILKHFDGSIGDGRALNFHAGNRRGTELAQRGVVKSHYLNLSGNLKIDFRVPFFDVFDPRAQDFSVRMAAGGSFRMNITEYRAFIRLHRLVNFELGNFADLVRERCVAMRELFAQRLDLRSGTRLRHAPSGRARSRVRLTR